MSRSLYSLQIYTSFSMWSIKGKGPVNGGLGWFLRDDRDFFKVVVCIWFILFVYIRMDSPVKRHELEHQVYVFYINQGLIG